MQQLVHIIDDDEAVRDAMSMLLESADIEHRTYQSANAFIEAYDGTQTGCLVLDIRMPGMSGLDLQQKLIELEAPLPIIFMTGHGDIPMAVQAMRLGAIDFMRKPIKEQNLIEHIKLAFEQDAAKQDVVNHQRNVQSLIDSLTQRELQVFYLVVQGTANKVIASELGISDRTVEVHRARVMEKLNAQTLAQLVRLSIELEPL
ncbi:MAG: two-component system response regulator FixJ [Saprospiraceae bacterium]|jgi:two-component system response regulator FixJ